MREQQSTTRDKRVAQGVLNLATQVTQDSPSTDVVDRRTQDPPSTDVATRDKRVAEGVLNLATQVTQVYRRSDFYHFTNKPNLMTKVNEANRVMYSFCVANNRAFIYHNSINST